jgi:hypothetical protein
LILRGCCGFRRRWYGGSDRRNVRGVGAHITIGKDKCHGGSRTNRHQWHDHSAYRQGAHDVHPSGGLRASKTRFGNSYIMQPYQRTTFLARRARQQRPRSRLPVNNRTIGLSESPNTIIEALSARQARAHLQVIMLSADRRSPCRHWAKSPGSSARPCRRASSRPATSRQAPSAALRSARRTPPSASSHRSRRRG